MAYDMDSPLAKALRKVYAATPLSEETGPKLVAFLDSMFVGVPVGEEDRVAKSFDDLFEDIGTIRENVRLAFQIEGIAPRR